MRRIEHRETDKMTATAEWRTRSECRSDAEAVLSSVSESSLPRAFSGADVLKFPVE